jgi:hypothetical protein
MAKVQRPPRKDSTQSVTTTRRYAHFPRNCERFSSGPSILNRS